MATNANWTIVFDDKCVIKSYAEGASKGVGYVISDDSFWSDSKFSNIWAIQYGTSNTSDEVEYRDGTQHTSYADANLGDISQFSSRWDSVHLAQLQSDWDNNNIENETADDKIARLGARPTSYSS
jgi:S-formylglutathione hydrolase FrmB